MCIEMVQQCVRFIIRPLQHQTCKQDHLNFPALVAWIRPIVEGWLPYVPSGNCVVHALMRLNLAQTLGAGPTIATDIQASNLFSQPLGDSQCLTWT